MASNAFADEIVNFNLVATANAQPSGPTLPGVSDASGSIVIDTTTGVVDAIDLSFANTTDPSDPPITAVFPWGPAPYNFVGITEIWLPLDGDGIYDMQIWLPVVSLVGYTGGPICSTEDPCYGGPLWGNTESRYAFGYSDGYVFNSGDLEPSPEPSSLILALTGALGIAAVMRRKKA